MGSAIPSGLGWEIILGSKDHDIIERLNWLESSFGFFHTMLWKNPNKHFGQLDTCYIAVTKTVPQVLNHLKGAK